MKNRHLDWERVLRWHVRAIGFVVAFMVMPTLWGQVPSVEELDSGAAERFAKLALDCVHREYPNKIAHVLNSDEDVSAPRELTPAFAGCFDWHSAVHGHWLLVRLTRSFPDARFASLAREALDKSLTEENIKREVEYISGTGRASFERPYGLAWLLQLAAELREWDDPQAKLWQKALEPLEDLAANRLKDWIPKLTHPIRVGEHHQTAFAFGLVLDWLRVVDDEEMGKLMKSRIESFYLRDRNCPLEYEPSGEDFLSPCLAEADMMRRILEPQQYAEWLDAFLPQIPRDGSTAWLVPAIVTDPRDPKLGHLHGLNLSRAWMLEGIASHLPRNDGRLLALGKTAEEHRESGLPAVTGEHYEGGHWLGSFATYLVTERGLK